MLRFLTCLLAVQSALASTIPQPIHGLGANNWPPAPGVRLRDIHSCNLSQKQNHANEPPVHEYPRRNNQAPFLFVQVRNMDHTRSATEPVEVTYFQIETSRGENDEKIAHATESNPENGLWRHCYAVPTWPTWSTLATSLESHLLTSMHNNKCILLPFTRDLHTTSTPESLDAPDGWLEDSLKAIDDKVEQEVLAAIEGTLLEGTGKDDLLLTELFVSADKRDGDGDVGGVGLVVRQLSATPPGGWFFVAALLIVIGVEMCVQVCLPEDVTKHWGTDLPSGWGKPYVTPAGGSP